MDHGVGGSGDDDELDISECEMSGEVEDGWPGVEVVLLLGCGVSLSASPFQVIGVKETGSDAVIEIGSIEQPSVSSDPDLIGAPPGEASEPRASWSEQTGVEYRVVLEGVFEAVEFFEHQVVGCQGLVCDVSLGV